MILQSYKFNIIHKPGRENIADCLSRLIKNPTTKNDDNGNISDEYINFITKSCIPQSMSLEQVRIESTNDKTLESVRNAIATGNWDSEIVKPYKQFKEQLTEFDGVITAWKVKFSFKDYIRKHAVFWSFTPEYCMFSDVILKRKLHFSCS